jgi:predicted dehydrogenase
VGWPDLPATPAFMLGALEGGPTAAERREKLRTSPYGRCVYRCDNDAVDHQVVAMEFEGGTTCAFTMHGHSDREGRTLRFDGTRATLYGDFGYGGVTELRIHPHGGGPVELIRPDVAAGGHGGGDDGLMADFWRALQGEPSAQRTTARASLASHVLAFAAEASRLSGQVVDPREA